MDFYFLRVNSFSSIARLTINIYIFLKMMDRYILIILYTIVSRHYLCLTLGFFFFFNFSLSFPKLNNVWLNWNLKRTALCPLKTKVLSIKKNNNNKKKKKREKKKNGRREKEEDEEMEKRRRRMAACHMVGISDLWVCSFFFFNLKKGQNLTHS